MFNKILKLIKEEYVTSYKFPWTHDETDVFKNPTISDINHIKDNRGYFDKKFRMRFVVDLENEDVYVWDVTALHQPVVDKLNKAGEKLNWKYLVGGVIELKDGKYVADWDNMTFSNTPKKIQKGGMILNLYIKHGLKEEYYKSVVLPPLGWRKDYGGTNIDVFKNPSRQELAKLLKEFRYLRFSMGDALYVWNGLGLHADILADDYSKMDGEYKGKIFPDSISIYMNSFGYRDEEEFLKEEDTDELAESFCNDPDIKRLGYTKEQIEWEWG